MAKNPTKRQALATFLRRSIRCGLMADQLIESRPFPSQPFVRPENRAEYVRLINKAAYWEGMAHSIAVDLTGLPIDDQYNRLGLWPRIKRLITECKRLNPPLDSITI